MRAEVAAQLGARADVERGERFVEQEETRLDHERSCECDALLLTTGELVRLGTAAVAEPDSFEPFAGASPRLAARHATTAEAERHVLERGEVGEQQVVLEHDPDRAALGDDVCAVRRVVDRVVVDEDASLVDGCETRERAQQRGLACAVGPEDGDGLAVGGDDVGVEVELAHMYLDVRVKTHGPLRTSGRGARRGR